MEPSFLLVQLSDPHIGAAWGGRDPVAGLQGAVAAVLELSRAPDAVLVSGDLTEAASDLEYQEVRELLAPLEAPVYALPGNHDDRAGLRRHFDLPGTGAEHVQYAVDLGPLRLVALDSISPGFPDGRLDADRLDWLDGELRSAPEAPTMIATHHPPLFTGMPAIDEIGLPAADREALGAVIERHPQVRCVVAGHVHRSITAGLAGRDVITVPSTYVQLEMDFVSRELKVSDEPSGFAVHAIVGDELVSHVRYYDLGR